MAGEAGDPAIEAAAPALSGHARMRFDRVRGKFVLLLPERAVLLSETAAEILRLCDGERSVAGIVDVLRERYAGADVRADVAAFLDTAAAKGWVRWMRRS